MTRPAAALAAWTLAAVLPTAHAAEPAGKSLMPRTPTEETYAIGETGWRIAAPAGWSLVQCPFSYFCWELKTSIPLSGLEGGAALSETIRIERQAVRLDLKPTGHCTGATHGSTHGKPTFSYSCEEKVNHPGDDRIRRTEAYRLENLPGEVLILTYEGAIAVDSANEAAVIRLLRSAPKGKPFRGSPYSANWRARSPRSPTTSGRRRVRGMPRSPC